MSRTSDIYLQDVDAISRIESYVEGTTRLAFETDRMRFDAVIRNLEIIGEAVKRVPNPIRQNHLLHPTKASSNSLIIPQCIPQPFQFRFQFYDNPRIRRICVNIVHLMRILLQIKQFPFRWRCTINSTA